MEKWFRNSQCVASLPPCGHQHSHFTIRTGAAAQLSRISSGFRRAPAARVPAASSAAAAALRQLEAELLYVCAVTAQHCSLTPQRMLVAPGWW